MEWRRVFVCTCLITFRPSFILIYKSISFVASLSLVSSSLLLLSLSLFVILIFVTIIPIINIIFMIRSEKEMVEEKNSEQIWKKICQ